VRPAKRFVFFVIASPVGGYGEKVFTPRASWSRTSTCAPRRAGWAA
jgi:hypothetical protein